jgi:tetratricopeptide (TPR) repeat protein
MGADPMVSSPAPPHGSCQLPTVAPRRWTRIVRGWRLAFSVFVAIGALGSTAWLAWREVRFLDHLRAAETELDLMAVGRHRDARHLLQRQLAHDSYAELWSLPGRVYDHEGDFTQAETCWRTAAVQHPTKSEPFLEMGLLAFQHPEGSAATASLKRTAERSPRSIEALDPLRQAYCSTGVAPRADQGQQGMDGPRAGGAS